MGQMKNDLKAAVAHSGEVATDVSENIESAVHSAGNGVRDAAHRVKEVAGHVAAAIEEQCQEVGRTAKATFDHGRTQARRWENRFEGAVRAKPLISVLIAGAAGLVAGLLWQCRRSGD